MVPVKNLAQYYVDLMVKVGILRFSFLLAIALIALAVIVQMGLTLVISGTVENIDIIRSIFFGLIITPWAIYFLSVVVDQLEDSRQRLTKVVAKLKDMRHRDQQLNYELKNNICMLNQEINERIKAEKDRERAFRAMEQEIFHRKKTQTELAEKSALLRSFIDASPDLIYYRNADSVFMGCNQAMERLTGLKEEELVGLTPWDVYVHEVAEEAVRTDKYVFDENREYTYEQWLPYPNGDRHFLELRKVPFFSKNGTHLGLLGFGRDITDRKHYEESLKKASQDKTTFISTISHELRTPLNGIVGLSRMLLDEELTSLQRQHLKTIHISAITLGNIFNDIVDMDKSERSKLALFPTELNFDDLLTEIESISAMMAEQKGLRFTLEKTSILPSWIFVDGTRLRQVIWNITSNAMKFTKDGGVFISVSAEMNGQNATIQIDIEDTGIGIPEDKLEKIFGMYYQVKSKTDNLHAVGTGIGLAVSKQLINLMGGDILVSSEEGFGSQFSIVLTLPFTDKAQEVKTTVEIKPLRVFLLEDIELNITVARALLEKMGHSVEVAMTGAQAIERFDPKQYDLAFLDIQLPDMTGFDVARLLREKHQHLPPLIALTANFVNDMDEYMAKGMDAALSKPLCEEAVIQLLDAFFDSEGKRRAQTRFEIIDPSVLMADAALCQVNPSRLAGDEDECKACLDVPMGNDKDAQSHDGDQGLRLDQIIDLDTLESFLSVLTPRLMLTNLTLFSQSMDEYLTLIDEHRAKDNQDGIVFEAHKIKGAAGSVGLKRIQQVAQKAQSPELDNWWLMIDDWLKEIRKGYLSDIDRLRQWLIEKEKALERTAESVV